MDKNLSQVEALNILIELTIISHKRGCFTLEESANAWNAIKLFIPNNTNSDTNNDEVNNTDNNDTDNNDTDNKTNTDTDNNDTDDKTNTDNN